MNTAWNTFVWEQLNSDYQAAKNATCSTNLNQRAETSFNDFMKAVNHPLPPSTADMMKNKANSQATSFMIGMKTQYENVNPIVEKCMSNFISK